MHIYRISSKGQVTVPKEVRECLELKEGDYITFGIEDGRVFIDKVQLVQGDLSHKSD
ncbi:AbrB/MazE/SpoVT family DNA-binding domain-containing protein [Baia soyae]|uniref:AbrB family looped-hinge helix DNA binding protein n=1 Tax=Baia soyae TaxID=1544746 RepID=A0A4R2RYE1_9BACL|nr:type II toxin-antitoxin system PrlF family antitoxin [Baia soyae]TCP68544.1 AbrB family looped-hinge helix DNA binding protein [Baia soyae]